MIFVSRLLGFKAVRFFEMCASCTFRIWTHKKVGCKNWRKKSCLILAEHEIDTIIKISPSWPKESFEINFDRNLKQYLKFWDE